MKKVVLLILLSGVFLFSQNETDKSIENELIKDIKYLSSEACFGRGIVHDGIYKAENYLSKELEKSGLKVYKQNVRIKINIPQGNPIFVINGDTLKAGYEYIPHPYSSSVNASFQKDEILLVKRNDLELLKDSLDLISISHARRYLLKHNKDRKDKILIFEESNPIVSRQNKKYPQAAFQVNTEQLPDTIKHIYAKHSTIYKQTLTRNVIAVIKGTSQPDSSISISAHYDHMGGLGDIYYPGANDNASGVAVVLALARYYAENPPAMTLIFCFFTGEEQGLYGSQKYVRHPVRPLKKNMMTLNLDMVGSGHDGWGLVAGKVFSHEAELLQEIANKHELGKLKLRDNAKNSDHFSFTDVGSKAMFIYASGGRQPYHHPDDIPETLDWEPLENIVFMIKEYILQKAKD